MLKHYPANTFAMLKMASSPTLKSSFYLFLFLFLFVSPAPALSKKSTYIVHVSHSHKPAAFASTHDWYTSVVHSLSSATPNTSSTDESMPNLLYSYTHAATGFAAHMSASHAAKLSRLPFVISVVPDRIVEPATTHTPSFLGLSDRSGLWPNTTYGSDVIVGVVDSGIWPESVSFHDHGMDDVPANWRGVCEGGPNFPSSTCNKKIIGARLFYQGYEAQVGPLNEIKSARDEAGHGSHCASTAAGSAVKNAGYYGYALGEARGMAPLARIAVYKVFWGASSKSTGSDILAAIDKAISDGVHVLSLSLSFGGVTSYLQDPVAIASLRAVQRGIVVSTSAGNSGPKASTVSNTSPWTLTVAASSIDREFSAELVLGNGKVVNGATLYDFRQLQKNSTASLMLVNGQAAASQECIQGKLIRSIVSGKVVICDMGHQKPVAQSLAVERAGGIGMILVSRADLGHELRAIPFTIPGIYVSHTDGNHIKSYVSSTPRPLATINFKGTIVSSSPSAPRLASFSSRGPNKVTPEILKPDVTAPGLNILAAWSGKIGPGQITDDDRVVAYNIISGTSMSCPHVSGLGALLRKAHPTWSPAAIKSAIMTTSYNVDNGGNDFIDLSTGTQSNPFVHGSGHVDPEKAVDPGLVYDLDSTDYIAFLCSIGYSRPIISQFVEDPSIIDCSAKPLASPGDLNYPSFAVVFKSDSDVVQYTRVVKNVGSSVDAVYQVSVSAPDNVRVHVSPTKLVFTEHQQTLSYTISFTSTAGFQIPAQSFGSIEWSDGVHRVKSPIAASWPYRSVVQDEDDFVASM